MWMILVPVIFIGGIFVVFYLFKDKFTGKTVAAYNEAAQLWADKEKALEELYSNQDKFGMLKDAVGDAKIEVLVSGQPKKGNAGKMLKKGAELLIGTETFDMSAHYLAIAGGELHYLHSDGKKIVEHAAYDLKALQGVDMKTDSAVASVGKFLLGDNKGDGNKPFNLSFTSNEVKYTFVIKSILETFAKFAVEKQNFGSSKFGDNPFSRVAANSITNTDNQLLYLFGAENHENFKLIMDKLAGSGSAPGAEA